MDKKSYKDTDTETPDTKEKKRLGKKIYVLIAILLTIGIFFRPQILLVNIKNWTMILSNVYTMLFDLCLGFAISLFFRNKLKKLTTVFGFALSLFFGCFLELRFEKDFIEKYYVATCYYDMCNSTMHSSQNILCPHRLLLN